MSDKNANKHTRKADHINKLNVPVLSLLSHMNKCVNPLNSALLVMNGVVRNLTTTFSRRSELREHP